MSESEPITTIQLHPLEQDGILEDLIAKGRGPGGFVRAFCSAPIDPDKAFSDLVWGRAIERQGEEVVFCFVPPEETKPEDKATGSASRGYDVLTPDGASRGYCDMYKMTPAQAERIIRKVKTISESRKQETS